MPPDLHNIIESHPVTRSSDKLIPPGRTSVTNIVAPNIQSCERDIIDQYLSEKMLRASIIDQFVRVYNFPQKNEWNTVMKCVRDNLKLGTNNNRLIKRTFETVAMQLTKKNKISPERKK